RTCTSCTLHANGLARPLANLIASLPLPPSRLLGHAKFSGGAWTALRMPELMSIRISAFHRLMGMVDRIIVLCNWTRDLLVRNGVPENKIRLCRQGINWSSQDVDAQPHRQPCLPLRAAFLGRLDPTKGAHVIVQALAGDRKLPVELDLFGIRQGE